MSEKRDRTGASQTFNCRLKHELVDEIELHMEELRIESFGEVKSTGEAFRYLAMCELRRRRHVRLASITKEKVDE